MSHLTNNQLLRLLDGSSDPGEQQRLSDHVAVCPKCRQELALQNAITRGIRLQPLATPSPRLTSAVMRRVIIYQKQSAALNFLIKHGMTLALIVGLSILGYALMAMPGWETAKGKIQTLQPEKKITQFYITANRQLMDHVRNMGEKIIDLAGEENNWLFVVAAVIIVMLALFDRLVVRQFMRTRS